MKRAIVVFAVVALVVALALPGLAAVVTKGYAPAAKGAGMAGVVVIDTSRMTAKITKLDTDKRMVSLEMSNGRTRSFKVPEDFDMSRLKVGDTITATVAESMAVHIEKQGPRPSAGEMTTVRLSPRGMESKMMVVNTMRMTGKIDSMDAARHTVTIMGPMGKSRMFKVGPNVKMDKLKVGDDIVVRYTEALAIDMRKPGRMMK